MPSYKFNARIEAGDGGGAHVLFPYDVVQEFGTRGKVPIQATFNRVPYRGTMIKYGHPQHMVPMSKEIRTQLGLGPGDLVEVEVWKDEAVRTLEVPEALQQAIEAEGLRPLFEGLSYTHRREYCRWIAEAKKEETRTRRVTKAIEMLRSGRKTPDAGG